MADMLRDDETCRIVVLQRALIGHMSELRLRMHQKAAHLIFFHEDGKPKHFTLTVEQADAFAEAWTAYRADCRARAEAEASQDAALIAEAYRIAQECPDIKIAERTAHDEHGREKPAWVVTVPLTSFNYHEDWAYTPKLLYEWVTDAHASWEHHQSRISTL